MRDLAKSIPCPLRAAALAAPDAVAIFGTYRISSYAELDRMVEATTTRLREAGFEPGERVALYLPLDERYIVLLLSLLRAGCVACPLSTRLPVGGVYQSVEKASCTAIISDDEDVIGEVSGTVSDFRPEALLRAGDVGTGAMVHLSSDQAATIVFTSGSTGGPRAALHTFGNHYYSALGSNANIPLAAGDRWLLSLPLYHVGGISIIFRCLLAGAAIALPERGESIDRAISGLEVTHISLVATQLRRLLETRTETGSLKAVLLGGGPTPGSLIKKSSARNIPVHTSYGLTEMASQVTTTPPDATPEELQTSGRELEHREVSISADGEILVRGETLFSSYAEGDRVDRTLDPAGWFHTRDLGELDEKGNLVVRGRIDNLFISGGENIQPEEIEAALERIEGVERAVVSPVPDDQFGERPVAFVQTTGERDLSLHLAGELGRVLPRFKVPVAFHAWPDDASEGMKPDRGFFRRRALRLQRRP